MKLNGYHLNGQQGCKCQCHPRIVLQWDVSGDNIHFSTSDVDALFVSERFNEFLFIEWKNPKNGDHLATAQHRLLQALASLPGVTVLHVHAFNDGRISMFRQFFRRGPGSWQISGQQGFERFCQTWYQDVRTRKIARWQRKQQRKAQQNP